MKDDDAPFDPAVEALLLNRLDEKPNIIKGCNSDEILISLGIGVFCGLLPSVILATIFARTVYGMAMGLILFGIITWQMIKIIGNAKLGRPPGFYKQKVAHWCINKGIFSSLKVNPPFILYKGRWSTSREMQKHLKDKRRKAKQ